jgi:hypothetical protein
VESDGFDEAPLHGHVGLKRIRVGDGLVAVIHHRQMRGHGLAESRDGAGHHYGLVPPHGLAKGPACAGIAPHELVNSPSPAQIRQAVLLFGLVVYVYGREGGEVLFVVSMVLTPVPATAENGNDAVVAEVKPRVFNGLVAW